MKTILFLLLSINCFSQRVVEYGITKQIWFSHENGIFCLAEKVSIDSYVDIKIQIARHKIIGPVFFRTKKGNFTMPVYKINKNDYSIIRLFFRLKEQWTSIDGGIVEIIVFDGTKWHHIKVNSNLKELKDYGNS